ncbi:MAG TPA: hypothetical protein DCY94_02975 [Firmicutes bacterium]|nr:hypothetical protein [Bacillota bacterium]
MRYDMKTIRALLTEREKSVSSLEDKTKVDNLKAILREDNIFFMIDVETALGILDFLRIPEENLKEAYLSLTSPEAFIASTDNYLTIGEK